jgi:hypothetical protein
MGPRYVAPSVTLKSFSCPQCGALADQTWFTVWCEGIRNGTIPFIKDHDLLQQLQSNKNSNGEPITPNILKRYEREENGDVFLHADDNHKAYTGVSVKNLHVSYCLSCSEISIWKHDTLLFPMRRYEIEPNEDMNIDIRSDFDEARSILDLSPRGSAALLRLCVQKLCKQLDKTGKDLNSDIASLVQDGLDVDIQQALDLVRVIGNDAVHPGELDLKDDRETASKLFELVNYIAEDRISRPKKLASLYSKMPPSKIAAIEKRDGSKTEPK